MAYFFDDQGVVSSIILIWHRVIDALQANGRSDLKGHLERIDVGEGIV